MRWFLNTEPEVLIPASYDSTIKKSQIKINYRPQSQAWIQNYSEENIAQTLQVIEFRSTFNNSVPSAKKTETKINNGTMSNEEDFAAQKQMIKRIKRQPT